MADSADTDETVTAYGLFCLTSTGHRLKRKIGDEDDESEDALAKRVKEEEEEEEEDEHVGLFAQSATMTRSGLDQEMARVVFHHGSSSTTSTIPPDALQRGLEVFVSRTDALEWGYDDNLPGIVSPVAPSCPAEEPHQRISQDDQEQGRATGSASPLIEFPDDEVSMTSSPPPFPHLPQTPWLGGSDELELEQGLQTVPPSQPELHASPSRNPPKPRRFVTSLAANPPAPPRKRSTQPSFTHGEHIKPLHYYATQKTNHDTAPDSTLSSSDVVQASSSPSPAERTQMQARQENLATTQRGLTPDVSHVSPPATRTGSSSEKPPQDIRTSSRTRQQALKPPAKNQPAPSQKATAKRTRSASSKHLDKPPQSPTTQVAHRPPVVDHPPSSSPSQAIIASANPFDVLKAHRLRLQSRDKLSASSSSGGIHDNPLRSQHVSPQSTSESQGSSGRAHNSDRMAGAVQKDSPGFSQTTVTVERFFQALLDHPDQWVKRLADKKKLDNNPEAIVSWLLKYPLDDDCTAEAFSAQFQNCAEALGWNDRGLIAPREAQEASLKDEMANLFGVPVTAVRSAATAAALAFLASTHCWNVPGTIWTPHSGVFKDNVDEAADKHHYKDGGWHDLLELVEDAVCSHAPAL
ncbi:hypothetical protein BDZ89DRAFT_1143080 [Hymenopellis radicata]|nr:hypothetical protein BDZ89DRAFT_1143080 [Hymenopellis radicata]